MTATARRPLESMEDWDDDLRARYPTADHVFRDYAAEVRPSVKEFYRLNHLHQTYDFATAKRQEYGNLDHAQMGVWEAMEFLDTLVDDSDPDTDLTQIEHLLQTAEAIRADGHPRWLVLTGLIHDLGKILCLWGEPQWAVVGDTFPLGVPFSDKVVFAEFFADNPDTAVAAYRTGTGIHAPGCGLDAVTMSWGHDEYIFRVAGRYLPLEAQYVLRYHSFYPWHREGAYTELTNEQDRAMLPSIRLFNTYDLYTKTDGRPDVAALKPYYEELIAEFFPTKINW
ncbi:inositol oxygenase family protein [Propionibacteriaceae bacterium Y1685]|uniref:inositol oxygenase family protein n=1 Tax=Microlunatus sp. Y1700 TaxID=3418487 RepID=UPI003B7AD9EC